MKLPTDAEIEREAAEHYATANDHGGSDANHKALVYEFHHDLNTAKRRAYVFATRELVRRLLASK